MRKSLIDSFAGSRDLEGLAHTALGSLTPAPPLAPRDAAGCASFITVVVSVGGAD